LSVLTVLAAEGRTRGSSFQHSSIRLIRSGHWRNSWESMGRNGGNPGWRSFTFCVISM